MKSKKVYGLLGVAALAVVGGTFAYYNSTDTFVNQFDTTNHGTSATEQFDPSKGHDWVPGAVVDKSVYATNTGDGDVWVRIKFNEAWTGLTSTGVTDGKLEWDSSDWDKFQPGPALGSEDEYEGYSAEGHQTDSTDKDGNTVSGAIDGLVANDSGSVVYKILNKDNLSTNGAKGKTWYYRDGYFYYCQALTKADPTTVELLQQVKLCGDTDMGKMSVSPGYFTIANKGLTGESVPKPTLKDDGTLADGQDKWYPLASDGSVPTKKITNADGSYYYIPVNITGIEAVEGDDPYKDASPVQGTEMADEQTVYTYKAKVLSSSDQGYANANYNLDITVEFVQADEEAAKAFATDEDKWMWNPDKGEPISYSVSEVTPEPEETP